MVDSKRGRSKSSNEKVDDKPKLLSGGNPQIPKGQGNKPVQAYIAALPGWKKGVVQRVDEIIVRTIPDVCKAVKWNSPLYGMDNKSWFLGIHAFNRYMKIAFYRGAKLDPIPPVESKSGEARYFHIHEDEAFDEKQFADWVKQASQIPGERM